MAAAVAAQRGRGVADIEHGLVRGKRQAIGFLDEVAHGAKLACGGVEPEHVAVAQLALGLVAFAVGHDAVGRVGEPDRPVGFDDHVVR